MPRTKRDQQEEDKELRHNNDMQGVQCKNGRQKGNDVLPCHINYHTRNYNKE